MTINADLLDMSINTQLEIIKKEDVVQGNIIGYLRKLEADIVDALNRNNPSGVIRQSTKNARLLALQQEVNQIIYLNVNQAKNSLVTQLTEAAKLAAEHTAENMVATLGIKIATPVLAAEQISKLADDTLIQGAPSAEWWARQIPKLRQRFADQMRLGIAQGDTNDQLLNRIRGLKARGTQPGIAGLMDMPERDLNALIRTSVQTVANAAHLELYQANAELMKGIMWVSTLDNRTTPICQALDGKMWDMDYKPIGHKFPFPGPTAHWGCRSTQVPVLKSFEQLAREAGGDTELAKKMDNVPNRVRASMDGQVPQTTTFNDWLKNQSTERQREILGPKRLKLWQDGYITSVDQLVTKTGHRIPLKSL